MSMSPMVEKIVERVKDKSLRDIGEKVLEDKRISPQEAVRLIYEADLAYVGALAEYINRKKEHNVRLRDIAKAMGLKLSEYGLFKADSEESLGGSTEEEIYELLGKEWIVGFPLYKLYHSLGILLKEV